MKDSVKLIQLAADVTAPAIFLAGFIEGSRNFKKCGI